MLPDSKPFQFDAETRRRLGYKLIDRISEYFESLPQRPVQQPAAQRTFGDLSDSLPEFGADAEQVLEDCIQALIGQGFHVPSGNYFGLMNPAPAYMGVLAEALVAALNPQLATLARSQLASKIERETVRWIGERVGWSSGFDGTFTSGGNEANFSGLALAIAAHFPGSIENGIATIGRQPVLYASTESHHSLDKSASLLGLGRKALHKIPVNSLMEMEPGQLEAAIESDRDRGLAPFCVVATSGTTNSGGLDDLESISEICKRNHLWLHVDGAYGASAVFSDKHRGLLRGIELADSITIDPHKWLAMPFAAGVILTSQPEMLVRAFGTSVPYMPKDARAALLDNFKVSTQWSRRMNSLKLWLTLRVHGRQAYEQHIDRQLTLAASFRRWLEHSQLFELAVIPKLPILNCRVRMHGSEEQVAAANSAVVDEVTRDGTRWISTTSANGHSVIRIMIISYHTGEEQLRGLQDAMTAAAARVLGKEPANTLR